MSAPSVKTRAVQGAVWTIAGYGTGQVLRLGSHLILAWFLAPEVFGLMSLVKVVQQGLEMFSDIGIRPAIIQNPRGAEPTFLNTAWTIQVIRGFALWLTACVLAWPFSAIYAHNDPAAWQLRYLLPVVAFGAVLQGLNSTALATLNKSLRLKSITLLELSKQAVSLTVMVVWAMITPTVWAMVAGGLAAQAYHAIASHRLMSGTKVRFQWDRACAAELIRFGRWIFLSTAFTFLALNLDKLILGNVLTLADLGLYSIACVFGRVALHVSQRLGSTVLYPVYSKYNHQPEQMMSVALRAREVVLWVGAAVSIGLAIASPVFFQLLWDERYHGAGPISQWVSLYIWATIVMLSADRIPLAMGNSRALFLANVWQTAGVALAVGGYFVAGLPGFIVGLSLGPLIAHVYLTRHMPSQRLSILMQGARFTLIGLVYAVPAALLTTWLSSRGSTMVWALVSGILAAVPLIVAARITWERVRGAGKGKAAKPSPVSPLTVREC